MLTLTEDELEGFCVTPEMAGKCADYVNARVKKWVEEGRALYSLADKNTLWCANDVPAYLWMGRLVDVKERE